ncbi:MULTISPECIES: hypothetical protein [Prochlorococcus]|nr:MULTISPECIES: hypothetical protein [Prochlorococcus]KGG10919.1 hypothetical protein EV04_1883 [Prochlorococcus marinus str. LG]KGG20503.1 hypothetical protein EV08_1089 [Prochlorococcus marinus str. SS2]KGG24168.1 hypothetical protein EV09_0775 [Prochlorococcus marinus str. SS35]KGG31574.1 hypothetical protein EV10_1667 [Prochlorococcus marinus str. SS51]KGG34640.1 hypothetical protein EV11_1769 [Prochlorococcus sp. SS52]
MSEDLTNNSVGPQITMELNNEVMAKLNYIAKERKMTINELINRLLAESI